MGDLGTNTLVALKWMDVIPLSILFGIIYTVIDYRLNDFIPIVGVSFLFFIITLAIYTYVISVYRSRKEDPKNSHNKWTIS